MRGFLCEYDSMQHEGVEWVELAGLDDFVIGVAIAVGDPALAVCAYAGKLCVVAAALDGVGIEEPEWGGPCAGGEVDIEVGL